MVVEPIYYYCPKCKKEYKNFEMISYNSRMQDAAEGFLKNNKVKTHCDECGVRLVKEEELRFYNENGEFSVKTKNIKFEENKIFDILLDVKRDILIAMSSLNEKDYSINLKGKIENVEKTEEEKLNKFDNDSFAKSSISVEVAVKDKVYTFFNIEIDKMEYVNIGRRFNGVVIEYLICKIRILIKTISDFLSHKEELNTKVSTKLNIVNFDKEDIVFYMKDTKID